MKTVLLVAGLLVATACAPKKESSAASASSASLPAGGRVGEIVNTPGKFPDGYKIPSIFNKSALPIKESELILTPGTWQLNGQAEFNVSLNGEPGSWGYPRMYFSDSSDPGAVAVGFDTPTHLEHFAEDRKIVIAGPEQFTFYDAVNPDYRSNASFVVTVTKTTTFRAYFYLGLHYASGHAEMINKNNETRIWAVRIH